MLIEYGSSKTLNEWDSVKIIILSHYIDDEKKDEEIKYSESILQIWPGML